MDGGFRVPRKGARWLPETVSSPSLLQLSMHRRTLPSTPPPIICGSGTGVPGNRKWVWPTHIGGQFEVFRESFPLVGTYSAIFFELETFRSTNGRPRTKL